MKTLMKNNTYTYSEICEIRNEKEKTGGSKKAQIKEWKKHFIWEYPINTKTKKPSKKFLIIKIIDYKESIIIRGGARDGAGRNNVFKPHMDKLLMLLADESQKFHYYTRSEIMVYSGIVSQKNYHLLLKKEGNTQEIYANNDFILAIQNKFFGSFKTACNNAYKQNVFTKETYLIYKKSDWDNRTPATIEEINTINTIKKNCLKEIENNHKYIELIKKHCKNYDSSFELNEGILFRIPKLYDIFKTMCDDKYKIAFKGKVCCKAFYIDTTNNQPKISNIQHEKYILNKELFNCFKSEIWKYIYSKKKTINENIVILQFYDYKNKQIYSSVLSTYNLIFNK